MTSKRELNDIADRAGSELNFTKYLATNAGKRLLQQHSLETQGLWQVYGEDPNCDMHGSHYMPEIGLFEGKLELVIRHAVDHNKFWQWGAGGEFKKVTVTKITGESLAEIKRLKDIKRHLEDELHNINQRLGAK